MQEKITPQIIEDFLVKPDIVKILVDHQILTKLLSVQSKISIIANIPPKDLSRIVYNLKFTKFKYRDIILKENETSNEIYYILTGECQIFVGAKKVASLTKGATFGEIAAIFNTPRTATIACASDEAMLLSFSIRNETHSFSTLALANIYKNLTSQINQKLNQMNQTIINK